jgi:hypothetical protein
MIGDTSLMGCTNGKRDQFKSSIFLAMWVRSFSGRRILMGIFRTVLIASAFISQLYPGAAQTAPVAAPAAQGSNAAGSTFTPAAPSDILRRSLEEVQQTIGNLKLDKWKRGTVRDEAGTNVEAIQRDLQGTLPSLLKEADAAPGSLSKVLPASRNLDALYDVLLHVVEAARVVAPGDQAGELQTTLSDLEKARVRLGNQLLQTAALQEKQMMDLRTTVQTQSVALKAAATPPPAPKCPAPATPSKKKKRPAATTTTKPAAGTPANPPAKPQQ